jgi:hypothetical protein
VAKFVGGNFVAAKVSMAAQKDVSRRLGAVWTPSIYMTTAEAEVVHQTIGWLPPDDFLTEFTYGLARAALRARDFEKSSRLLREAAANAAHDRAPEAMYWLGVSEYRRSGGIDAAKVAWKALAERWPGSTFAKRAGWLAD